MWWEPAEKWFSIVHGERCIFGVPWHSFVFLFLGFLVSLWIADKLAYERGKVEEAERQMKWEEKQNGQRD